MSKGIRPVSRDQPFLLPPDMEKWLPADHLVWFILDTVEALSTVTRSKPVAGVADVVRVLALAGLRWAELAGLQVGDRVKMPGEGLRLQRTVMSSRDKGALFEDTLESKRSRTVPLVADLVPVNDKWPQGKKLGDWLFPALKGGPLSEPNWKRSVSWRAAVHQIGRPTLRVHDLRHTCASSWLGAGATRTWCGGSFATPQRP
jgi:integrase